MLAGSCACGGVPPPNASPCIGAVEGLDTIKYFSSARLAGGTVEGAPMARSVVSTMGKLSGVTGPGAVRQGGDRLMMTDRGAIVGERLKANKLGQNTLNLCYNT